MSILVRVASVDRNRAGSRSFPLREDSEHGLQLTRGRSSSGSRFLEKDRPLRDSRVHNLKNSEAVHEQLECHGECSKLVSAVFELWQEAFFEKSMPAQLATSPISKSELPSVSCCEKLEELQSQLEMEHDNLLHYKGRKLSGRPLHFAVWCAYTNEQEGRRDPAAEIKALLWARANPRARAWYKRKTEIVQLPALHVAAGLGCVPAMEALLDDRPAAEVKSALDEYCTIGGKPYYAPLHDAMFGGKKDAAEWLLEQGANPKAQNSEGFSSLHWLALRGLDSEADVEAIVKSLVMHKAHVDETTHDEKDPQKTIIPLEFAVKPGSLYPKRLLHLLAPSYQILQQAKQDNTLGKDAHSFLEDLALMSSHSCSSAYDFADLIQCMTGPRKQLAFEKAVTDAQRHAAVDCVASLLQMAPEAAAVMLGLLIDKPVLESPGHHPLSSRALLRKSSMVCAYRPDHRIKRLGKSGFDVRWPEWKYDAEKGIPPAWHKDLVREPQEAEYRSNKVSDVETDVLLLPNILDIDVFMALASIKSVHRQIFEALPIQAAVYCLWSHLVGPVFMLTLIFNLIDLGILAVWGTTPGDKAFMWRLTGTKEEDSVNSSLQRFPHFWYLLLAGTLRDLCNLCWWYYALCTKYYRHRRNVVVPVHDGRGKEMQMGLHALWHPMKIFDLSHNTNMPELVLIVIKSIFMLDVFVSVETCGKSTCKHIPDHTQALLAVCFFMQSVKFIYMLRVSEVGGKKILVLLKTLVSGAMREMGLVALLFFLAFVMTAVMLDRQGGVDWVSWSLYRGLLFGDGAGLDNMGFRIEGGEGSGGVQRWADINILEQLLMLLAVLGTLVFIVILNMIIAIYSNEYSKLENESEILFQRERAKYCCTCLVGLQKLRTHSRCYLYLCAAMVVLSALGSAACFTLVAPSPGGGDILAICIPILGSVLLMTAQVGIQALMMRSEWFAVGRNGDEGPEEEHFLWICRRCEVGKDVEDRNQMQQAQAQAKLEEFMDEIRSKMDILQARTEAPGSARGASFPSSPASPFRSSRRQESPERLLPFHPNSTPATHASYPGPSNTFATYHSL
eukprot:TRINITY_DN36107_c0_g1_i1.p1 TRINITY_DN36107_c0_g1~~TRINITY_DN36107_c0_g1_i1.p1  ORF type:complete len:1069 (-),score=217.63 TRINITY_DN36107_c0_g1_i1:75-3281(-)